MKILVTGASGFVGRSLCSLLTSTGYQVIAALRSFQHGLLVRWDTVLVGEINESTDWSSALRGVDVVIHLAARVHVMRETSSDALGDFRRVNVEGTKCLAQQAALNGVQHFVFLSSIKVNGEKTMGRPFSADDEVDPHGPYAKSKHEAEQSLLALSLQTAMPVTIVRSPLVYGPEVGGNFLRLLKLIDSRCPLPFGRINNRRSLVGVGNLCHLLAHCVLQKPTESKVYLVSDGEDLSTKALILRIAGLMNKSSILLPIPDKYLYSVARFLQRTPELDRLCGSLQVGIEKTRQCLNWNPPYSADENLYRTVKWYQSR